jgi:hypothetical protein
MKRLYKIRPHTLDMMRAILPFFEIVACSNLKFHDIEQIVDHLELLIDYPVNNRKMTAIKRM